ncbi:DNA primase [Ectobacillus ponti]|uniref:DNA primase n=1 Tax=Ectobacillus ponti TaxID=2961894 RepID=A0AA41X212_9BACI|nr:DNA primase [Ectobacillus ponti]MCP8967157.1 DNA primase [Ectobacillus ponti]
MGNRIPEELVERVRQANDIVDVVGEHVQLRKQGRNYFGLCPFHGESTPSFSVSPDKQIFHCFGCGEGGNAISFVMKIDNLSFSEAVQKLGEKAGIHVAVEEAGQQETAEHEGAASMIEAHELLKKYYHHLLVNTEEGKEALEYLQQRGITKELIVQFELGYASAARDHAVRVLQRRGYTLPLMEQAGLIGRSETDGTFHDRFRHRIMFPIQDLQGRTVAFSGRSLGEAAPKYLNSPETPIFHKSKVLYNFHRARPAIRNEKRVLLYEGYADVLASISSGLPAAVATMGTALTEEQARILRRNVEQIILCYDGDNAGQKATVKAGSLLLKAGCEVRVLLLPDKLDPDEFVRRYGHEAFRRRIETASAFADFRLQYLRIGRNLQSPREQGEYIQEAVRELAQLTGNLLQAQPYLRLLAEEFAYPIEDLRNEFERSQSKVHKDQKKEHPARQAVKNKPKLIGYRGAEREIIFHMLRDADVAGHVQPYIEYFHTEEHKGILYELYAYYEKGNEPSISAFLNWLTNDSLKQIVIDIAEDELINPEYSTELLEGSLESLRKHKQRIEEMDYTFQLRNLEKQDSLAAARFAQEYLINRRKARR